MDFQKLMEILPKPSTTWTITDIQIWLNFIGLQQFYPNFKEHSVDGSCLAQLTEQDLRCQLKIQSKIISKKIITWITTGIDKFDQELRNSKQLTSTLKGKQLNISLQKEKCSSFSNISTDKFIKPKLTETEHFIQPIKRQMTHNDSNCKKQQDNQLIIRQCDVVQAANYSLKGSGGMIGRHSSNQILVLDQFVSRFHAQIQFQDGQYYIRDNGSSSGTFIRITQKLEIKHGMIIQLGSNQFQIDLTQPDVILLVVIQGSHQSQVFSLSKIKKSTIGRKNNNDIHFIDDQHLSNMHATIFPIQGVLYIEDLGTTNGTWTRLSAQNQKSERHRLDDKTQFKLSSNLTYQCRRNKTNRKTLKGKTQKCLYCGVGDRNALFIPCKHILSCFECASSLNLTKCQLCESGITDLIKIFTA